MTTIDKKLEIQNKRIILLSTVLELQKTKVFVEKQIEKLMIQISKLEEKLDGSWS